jgi:GT2 family glycosyltransferase
VTPACSIVIPVHGRAGLTRRCLDALLAEPGIEDAEVIVVDDGSPDDTTTLLGRYGEAIRVHARDEAGGFATACNDGAALAPAPLLLFLNNDTQGQRGWLRALLADADAHPDAAVIGAKLLFPNGTVQHAGVSFGRDGLPRHVYAGFPADHPAVCRSRSFQAVTAACMLVRGDVWHATGGFDPGYRNGLEDTDLCLRVGALGHDVRCCHDSVLLHFESATRGRRGPDLDAGVARFRERWAAVVQPDDLEHFAADGLLRIDYSQLHPMRITVCPELASVNDRADELQRLLARRAAQVHELLRETLRLTVQLAEVGATGQPSGGHPRTPAADTVELLRDAQAIEGQIGELQERLAQASPHSALADAGPSPVLTDRGLVARLRDVVEATVPTGATVVVVSRGDDELVDLGERAAWHFPQTDHGEYAGHHPGDGAEAVAHLEELRTRGAEYLVVPRSAYWWLDFYTDLALHLRDRCRPMTRDADTCMVYALAGGRDGTDR